MGNVLQLNVSEDFFPQENGKELSHIEVSWATQFYPFWPGYNELVVLHHSFCYMAGQYNQKFSPKMK